MTLVPAFARLPPPDATGPAAPDPGAAATPRAARGHDVGVRPVLVRERAALDRVRRPTAVSAHTAPIDLDAVLAEPARRAA